MLMASLTGISVIGILGLTLKDCWAKKIILPKLKLVWPTA
jgi:hypothetical protein